MTRDVLSIGTSLFFLAMIFQKILAKKITEILYKILTVIFGVDFFFVIKSYA